jgi:hypothetical protein
MVGELHRHGGNSLYILRRVRTGQWIKNLDLCRRVLQRHCNGMRWIDLVLALDELQLIELSSTRALTVTALSGSTEPMLESQIRPSRAPAGATVTGSARMASDTPRACRNRSGALAHDP